IFQSQRHKFSLSPIMRPPQKQKRIALWLAAVAGALVGLMNDWRICLVKMSESELHTAWNQALSGALYSAPWTTAISSNSEVLLQRQDYRDKLRRTSSLANRGAVLEAEHCQQ
ncbi:unnamed protein product, partial [Durusdinium trenchii]